MTDAAGRAAQPRLDIAYLLQQFPIPSQTFAVSDIAALCAQGHRVTVYTMKRRRRDEDAILELCGVPAGVPIMRPSFAGGTSWPALIWRWRKEAARLSRQIITLGRSSPRTGLQALLCIPRAIEVADQLAKARTDVVHVFWARHIGMVLALLQARGSPAVRSAFVGAYDLVADDFLVDMSLGAAETAFSHAEANRPYLERKAAANAVVDVIRRGIPLHPHGDEAQRGRFRWITASSLIPAKNVEAVIRAFAKARRREPRLTLRVCGDGPDRSRLERLALKLGCSDAVSFAGHISRDALFSELQRAGAFLLLSKQPSERLPNVVKEALWAGCAVVSSNSEGIEEIIPDSGVGYVVDPDDEERLQEILSAILAESPEAAAERRRRARALIAERFSSDSSMRRYVDSWRLAAESKA